MPSSRLLDSAYSLLKRNKVIFENFSYLTLFQVLGMVFPLITYPYLTRTLGAELYGLVITAQVLSSYCTIVVQFGFPLISARHISIHKDNKDELSRIMSAILVAQFVMWIVSFFGYMAVITLVPTYNEHFWLFFYSFFLTLTSLLFPQFYFQGTEKMKYITIIQLVFQLIFVSLTFVVIKQKSDYIYVPLLYSIGYLIGGLAALYIIFVKDGIKFRKPTFGDIKFFTKDALPIFTTDVVCTIKDKFNYLLLGSMVNMSQVVTYDVGSKLSGVMMKPISIILTVVFPKMARDRDDRQFKKICLIVGAIIIAMFLIVNLFLSPIVKLLIGQEIDLLPVRLYLVCPIFLSISTCISRLFLVARGYNKIILYSIIVTIAVYLVALAAFYAAGRLNDVSVFVMITLISYAAELVYRAVTLKRLQKLQ